jgi:diguanylate cyclase (GGDEF)-like protein
VLQNISINSRLWNAILVLVFAIIIWLAYLTSELQTGSDIKLELEANASVFKQDVSDSLRRSMDNLRSVSSILIYFDDVNFQQFKNFAQTHMEGNSGLEIIEWQRVVLESERQLFIEYARQSGLPDFELWEPDVHANKVAAAIREEHVVNLFALSPKINADTIGMDLAWSEARMASKWKARDEGRAQASGFFAVLDSRGVAIPVGFAITLPVYAGAVVPTTIEERHQKLLGYVAGVYALQQVLLAQLNHLNTSGFNVTISDGQQNTPALESIAGPNSAYSLTTPINVYGSQWQITLTAIDGFVPQSNAMVWWLMLFFIVAFGGVFLVFMSLLQRNNLNLQSLHSELEQALKQVKKSEAHFSKLARIDPLTGLYNRRDFFEKLPLELEKSARNRYPMALLLLDIDHFKRVNDNYGHPAGDEVLRSFADICKAVSRRIDYVARIGGEEFAILLSHLDQDEAHLLAERLLATVANAKIELPQDNVFISVSVSIGLAMQQTNEDGEQLLNRADQALYTAKKSGRNQVVVCDVTQNESDAGLDI